MNEKEMLAFIADAIDYDGDLALDVELAKLECWDSVSKLTLIIMVEESYNKTLEGEQVKEFKTVDDIVKAINS
jgi:acyl carrier protein